MKKKMLHPVEDIELAGGLTGDTNMHALIRAIKDMVRRFRKDRDRKDRDEPAPIPTERSPYGAGYDACCTGLAIDAVDDYLKGHPDHVDHVLRIVNTEIAARALKLRALKPKELAAVRSHILSRKEESNG